VDALAAVLPRGYVSWIRAAAAALEGRQIVLAPAHRDLTMANVLLDGPRLGVLDWEAAREADLPLVDLPYAIVDAVSTVDEHADRPAAFARSFESGGRASPAGCREC
jgi:aminoglycoside phosphotransferase (APT) family kinase protein